MPVKFETVLRANRHRLHFYTHRVLFRGDRLANAHKKNSMRNRKMFCFKVTILNFGSYWRNALLWSRKSVQHNFDMLRIT